MQITQKAGKKEWIGLAVISLPCMLYSMDLTVLNLAVPSLSADLQPSSSELLWIVDIYGFMIAGSLLTMGTLGDRIGRRKLLLIGAMAFGIASVFAAFSTSAAMLIATRALLGVAGATLAPSTLSLIRNMFLDSKERTMAIGVWATSFSVGGAIGPVLGGLFLQHYWWGSVFLLGLPIMVMLLVLGPIFLPEFKDPNAGRIDLLSVFLALVSVLTLVYGLKHIAQSGWEWKPSLLIAAGLALGIIFTKRQKSLKDPLIDLALFKVPAFSASLAANTLSIFVSFGMFLYIAQYLQLVLGLPPLEAGVWLLPSSIGFIAGSLLAPKISRRIKPGIVMSACLAFASVGFALLTQVEGHYGLTYLVTGSLIFSLGLAPVITLGVDMIVGAAPPERAGAASGISETSTELGGALGIAILGSIGTAIYRHYMHIALLKNIPQNFADVARDTLGAAVEVAEKLPAHTGVLLLATAREAFTRAFVSTAAFSSVLLLITASITLFLLKDVTFDGE